MQTSDLSTPALRLSQLRAAMREQQIDAYIVPSADPHLSEYLPGRWQGREWLSGFTGSVGTLVVTQEFAGVWTDGRYWEQAETELAGSGIVLKKIPSGASVLYIDWLGETMQPGQTVGVDGAVLGLANARFLQQALSAQVTLRTDTDLLQQVWLNRPAMPAAPVFEHGAPYPALPRTEKLAALRAAMAQHGASHHVISTLDDIAWLFNLRGADVHYNPVFVAHALVGPERTTLFVADGKVPAALRATLEQQGVDVAPYEQAAAALAALPATATLLLDPRRITYGTRLAVPEAVSVVEAINPTTFAKSRKTDTEAAHVRAAMEQDGAALCEFFSWLDATLADPQRAPLTEIGVDEHLTAARARRTGFVSPSFGTIAGFNAHGAIMHYHAHAETAATIEGDGLLLIDSGGQYLGGTTDITRVVPVGTITADHKRDFTLVLRSMIALSRAQFPLGVKSPMLDSIARAPLWAEGIDFGHGTGHGVGFFLNVHEGPQSISQSAMPEAHTAMQPGMITSVEPGIYRPGRWGIRIENLVLNVAVVAAGESEFGPFLRFETLTLCPIDTRCVERSLLRDDEAAWLNDYHATVRARLSPHLAGSALAWLEQRTGAI
ncbi:MULTISPECIES: aminopeptidase P family protein [unclassified Janthinobacterium]|uniref:aminopeptidase P family protein n=1 Tax=unclassified Janthinobacterium TaxID=2610881 RepID=UPI00162103D7|nr:MULTISPECIES: aminopeptidase P family protein [unclassified Janthinobacterium]MBB5370181.1 Xaa-Pro aminopeptidase [Janthinobacterium sp. K2C7]MBB5382987.1 Xaa-Pro aminopeptidase [Janthinobacterium sp. K2Li3]MBB5388534.1 Xaa-Pro aminopeptidase [Janthinobacterium sp. K2E3]